MMTIDEAKDLLNDLQVTGTLSMTTVTGKSLFIAEGRVFGKEGLMLALEGGGCILWDKVRPLNAFRLITAKFDSAVATTIANLGNALAAADLPNIGTQLLILEDNSDARSTPAD